jgi:hypothetical protein
VVGAGCGRSSFGLLAKNLISDIGPKFLQLIGNKINRDLRSKIIREIPEASFFPGVIRQSDARGSRIAAEFGDIELSVVGIGTGNKQALEGVTAPVPETTFALPEVAWILAED